MKPRHYSVLALVASVLALGGWLNAQEGKKETKPEPKLRGSIPANYSKLGLDEKQKQDIYKIQADFDVKIADLEAQIKKLRTDERTAMEKVLTAAQKARLKEILKEKIGTVDDSDSKESDASKKNDK